MDVPHFAELPWITLFSILN